MSPFIKEDLQGRLKKDLGDDVIYFLTVCNLNFVVAMDPCVDYEQHRACILHEMESRFLRVHEHSYRPDVGV